MGIERINLDLPEPLSNYVSRMVEEGGPYPSLDAYVLDLIRRDMEQNDTEDELQAKFERHVIASYEDFAAGRFIESTGNFDDDMALFAKREAKGWK